MAMGSYRQEDHACFAHFQKPQKLSSGKKDFSASLSALLIFQPIFANNIVMESFSYIDYTSFVRFEISQKI